QELGTLGFECTSEEVDLEDITENQINTIKACTDPGVKQPETGRNRDKISVLPHTHSHISQQFPLSQGKCLQGISQDLRAYRAQLRNLGDPQLLVTLDGMMEVRIP
ncbi:IL12A protein, partial [Dicrurus megarhynchus]|nr:IL12A protein [Dicrurus megarhynchus]